MMKPMQEIMAANPLADRKDAVEALLSMCRPLIPYYSANKALLFLGSTGAHYGEKSAAMESWARILWGLAPLFAGDNTALPADLRQEIEQLQALYRQGMLHGTDPEDPEYWGDIIDCEQKMVETAAIALALLIAPKVFWEPLSEQERDQVYRWLDGINNHEVHPNNWRYFRILTNLAFMRLELPYREVRLEEDFALIENCYMGDGWYFDGKPEQMDYYIPFAMHYYGLIWSKLSDSVRFADPQVLKQRAREFAGDFILWFSDDGTEVPFGRSLTYRFAHCAFFSALAFAEVEGLPWGQTRRIVMQNLRSWFSRPIFDNGGILTIGYRYPNLLMSEKYNAPGSPYWAFKAFLFLALPEDHPFWTSKEEPIPVLKQPQILKNHMLAVHDTGKSGTHVMLFPAGQHCAEHGNSSAKYEKFVYSNRFGFSISRGYGLAAGAFDNTLAWSEAWEEHYRMRYGCEAFQTADGMIWMKYRMLHNVMGESTIVPLTDGWHIRIHIITADREVKLADGGFAISAQADFQYQPGRGNGIYGEAAGYRTEHGVFALFPWGTSGIAALGTGQVELISAFPNTNLYSNLTLIPTVKRVAQPGESCFVTLVYASMEQKQPEEIRICPQITRSSQGMEVCYKNERKAIRINHRNANCTFTFS